LYLLTNLPDLKSASQIYGQRYGREATLKTAKLEHITKEGSQASPDKLMALIFNSFT